LGPRDRDGIAAAGVFCSALIFVGAHDAKIREAPHHGSETGRAKP